MPEPGTSKQVDKSNDGSHSTFRRGALEDKEDQLDKKLALRQKVKKGIVHLVILLLYMLILVTVDIAVYTGVAPINKRGFFCNDYTIMHKVKPYSVPTWAQILVGFLINLPTFLLTDLVNYRRYKKNNLRQTDEIVKKHVKYMKMISLFKSLLINFISLGMTVLVIVIGRKFVGALRPDFLHSCYREEKEFRDICHKHTEDNKMEGYPVYIKKYRCTNKQVMTEKNYEDAVSCFPSLTAGYLFAVTLFSLFYINFQLVPLTVRYGTTLWQAIVIIVCGWISFTFLIDNKSYLRDIAASFVVALIVSTYHYLVLHRTKADEGAELDKTIL